MSLNYVDIILLLPMLFGLVRGLFKGFIREVLGLTAIVLGIAASYYYADDLASYLRISLPDAGAWLDIVSYATIFTLTLIAMNLIARYLTKVSKLMALGLINRLAGGIFGFAKIVLILMLILYLFGPWLSNWRAQVPEWKNSGVYDVLEENSMIPGDLYEKARESIHQEEFDFPTIETP